MSQRRMFSQDIVCSDAFLDMPPSTQALYFHLAMRADDDGFVNPKMVMRLIGSPEDDLKVLLGKRFVLRFESGVVVIKHWLIHNLIRSDLYKETLYLEEKSLIGIKDNGSYTELREGVSELKRIEAPKWLKIRRGELRTANVPQTAHRIGKDRIGKDSTETKENKFHSISYLKEIPQEDLREFTERFVASPSEIKTKAEDLVLWCESNGKKKKNYRAFLLTALRKDFRLRIKVAPISKAEPQLEGRPIPKEMQDRIKSIVTSKKI